MKTGPEKRPLRNAPRLRTAPRRAEKPVEKHGVKQPETSVVTDGFTAVHKKLIMALAAAGLVGVLVKANCTDDRQSPKHADRSAEVKPGETKHPEGMVSGDREAQTEQLIGRAERGMGKLTTALRQKTAGANESTMAKALLEPMELVKVNQKNPNRNAPRFHRQARENGETMARQDNINYFGYSAGKRSGFAASYEPPTRIMELAPDFEEDNLLDVLILQHELRHVMQDTQLRTGLQSEAEFRNYLAMYTANPGGVMKVFLVEEASAYMYEIEAMDLLLDGELKAAHREGREVNLENAMRKLKARPDQKGMVEMLVKLSGIYYRSGSGSRGITGKFIEDLVVFHRERMAQNVEFYESANFRNLKRWGK